MGDDGGVRRRRRRSTRCDRIHGAGMAIDECVQRVDENRRRRRRWDGGDAPNHNAVVLGAGDQQPSRHFAGAPITSVDASGDAERMETEAAYGRAMIPQRTQEGAAHHIPKKRA